MDTKYKEVNLLCLNSGHMLKLRRELHMVWYPEKQKQKLSKNLEIYFAY